MFEETLSTKLFFSILDSLSDGIYISDRNGLTLWLNKSSENLCGIPRSELIGKNVKELEKRGIFHPSITIMTFETGKTVSAVQTLKSGRKILVTGHLIPDAEGNTDLVIAHSRDISETIKTSSQLEETKLLLNRYIEEFQILTRQQNQKFTNHNLLGESRDFENLLELIKKVAVVDSTILITGESGVGKSMIAEYIHKLSNRCKEPFIQVNCSAYSRITNRI
jgi:PAS domain S-box-containing protein